MLAERRYTTLTSIFSRGLDISGGNHEYRERELRRGHTRGRYLLRQLPVDGRDEFALRRPRRGATTPTQNPRESGTAIGMPAPHFDSPRRFEDAFTQHCSPGPYLPTIVVTASSIEFPFTAISFVPRRVRHHFHERASASCFVAAKILSAACYDDPRFRMFQR